MYKKLFGILIFTVGMLLRGLQCCIQTHQKPCYTDGLVEVNMIEILKMSDMARTRIAKWYVKWWISEHPSSEHLQQNQSSSGS